MHINEAKRFSKEDNILPNTQKEKIILRYFCLLFVLSLLLQLVFGETKVEAISPDIWHREIDANLEIARIIYVEGEWPKEPFALLFKPDAHEGIALGFFSGAKKKVYRKLIKRKGNEESYHYAFFESKTNRQLVPKFIFPQTSDALDIPLRDGGRIVTYGAATFSRGQVIDGLYPEPFRKQLAGDLADIPAESYEEVEVSRKGFFEKLRSGEITYASVGDYPHVACEPASDFLVKLNSEAEVIWAKAILRFDRNPLKASTIYDKFCDAVTQYRIQTSASPKLLLEDGTMLIGGPSDLVRIRIHDGWTKAISSKVFGVFDAVDIINIKLEMMKEEVQVLRQCLQGGEKLLMSVRCGKYRNGTLGVTDYQSLEDELATRIFVK